MPRVDDFKNTLDDCQGGIQGKKTPSHSPEQRGRLSGEPEREPS